MLKVFFGGYQRKIADLKHDVVMSAVEGKLPLSLKGYKFLSAKAMDQSYDYDASIFSNFFLIMYWNLIARCVSVGSLMHNHISRENDSLVVVFPSHKGDKEKTVFAEARLCKRYLIIFTILAVQLTFMCCSKSGDIFELCSMNDILRYRITQAAVILTK